MACHFKVPPGTSWENCFCSDCSKSSGSESKFKCSLRFMSDNQNMTPMSQWSLPFHIVIFLSLCLCPLQAEESLEKQAPLLLPTTLPSTEQLNLPKVERVESAQVKAKWLESLSTDLSAKPASQSSVVEQIHWDVDYQNEWFSSKLKVRRKLSDGEDEVGTELLVHPTDNLAIGASATSQTQREASYAPKSVWDRPSFRGTLRWTW